MLRRAESRYRRFDEEFEHLLVKFLDTELGIETELGAPAQCLEISLAHVRIPHQSVDSDYLLFAALNPLVGFPTAIQRLVMDTVKNEPVGPNFMIGPTLHLFSNMSELLCQLSNKAVCAYMSVYMCMYV